VGILLYNVFVKKTLITIELFLTLLVVLLFGFLLFIFTNKKIDNNAVTVNPVDTSELYCGIAVTSPKIEEITGLPLRVSGYISGCGWDPYLNYVATLKIFDEENKMVGRPIIIQKKPVNPSPVSYQFDFEIKDLPVSNEKIYLKFYNFGILEKEYILPVNLSRDINSANEQ
jgi:hypothetical protein